MRNRIKQLVQEVGISEIENVLEELKREKCSCDNHQKARNWFYNLLMGVSINKREDCPDSLFFKNRNNHRVIMEQDFKNNSLWISYSQIWSVFKNEYDLNNKEIGKMIKDIVSEIFKIKVSASRTPLFIRKGW